MLAAEVAGWSVWCRRGPSKVPSQHSPTVDGRIAAEMAIDLRSFGQFLVVDIHCQDQLSSQGSDRGRPLTHMVRKVSEN